MNPAEPSDQTAETEQTHAVPPGPGFGTLLTESLGAFIDHLEARLELLRLEANEARAWLLRRVVAAIAAVLCIAFAYLLLWIGLIGWIARASGIGWFFVTLMAAGLHLLIAFGCWVATRRPFSGRPFEATLAEFHHDRERLRRGGSTENET